MSVNPNDELAQLSSDYSRHVDLLQIRNNLVNNPHKNNVSQRILEHNQYMGAYIPPSSTTPMPQIQYHMPQQPGNNGSSSSDDPRANMNERLGNFRFDTAGSAAILPSLVPVNMDHVYSGNLFAEGLPVPADLRGQFTLSSPNTANPSARIHHQSKSKTMYRNDTNDRLAELSPLSRTLFYPTAATTMMLDTPQIQSSHQQYLQANGPQQISQINTRKGDINDSINQRVASHPSLSAPMALPPNNVNQGREQYRGGNQPQSQMQPRVVYQDMYPVMSK